MEEKAKIQDQLMKKQIELLEYQIRRERVQEDLYKVQLELSEAQLRNLREMTPYMTYNSQ